MRILGVLSPDDEPVEYMTEHYTRDGQLQTLPSAIQEENLLQVLINGIPTMQLACSRSNLGELVIGHLFTESYISSIDDVAELVISEKTLQVYVYLYNKQLNLSRANSGIAPAFSAGGVTANGCSEAGKSVLPVTPTPWNPAWVFRVAEAFYEDKTSHARTRGVHSAYLATPRRILVCREDIGRHNAFDKVVGWALNEGVDIGRCMLFTSGRVPIDMVTKTLRAGIPILASKTVATDKAVTMAREYNLTLICSTTLKGIDVLNDPVHAHATISQSA